MEDYNYHQNNNQGFYNPPVLPQKSNRKVWLFFLILLVLVVGVVLFLFINSSSKIVSESEFSQGTSFELKENKEIKFLLDEEEHTITVNSVSSNSVDLIIRSNPIQVSIKIGEEKKFDLDSDGFYDILIKLNSINERVPELYIKKIREITCTENWTCGNWSSCSGQVNQTRTCTDSNSCGTTRNKSSTTQSCVCTENWTCGNWSSCSGQVNQTRTCTDSNSCGTTRNKSSTTQRGICVEDSKSNFFKNDSIVKYIINDNLYILNLSNYYSNSRFNVTSFEFKLLNAFKQLGYSQINSIDSPLLVLNKFQEKNNLSVSPTVDKTTIILLGESIYKSELKDLESAKKYPPYSKFLNGPMNEPSKEHLARIFYEFSNSLPDNLLPAYYFYGPMQNPITISEIFSIREFLISLIPLSGIYWGTIVNDNSLEELDNNQITNMVIDENYSYKFCGDRYYSQIKTLNDFDKCKNTDIVYNGGVIGDLAYAQALAHEFAHSIGEYKPFPTDPESAEIYFLFGNISFDLSSGNHLRNENNQEFVSLYAKTNYLEDFAESFTSYIFVGKIFRERAKENSYLLEKYIFLKNRVFKGIEYDTSNLKSYDAWLTKNGNTLPPYSISYMIEDPDWVWDYQYPVK